MSTIPQVEGTPMPAPPEPTPVAPAPPTSGAASHAQQVAPAPKDTFTPRKFTSATSSSSTGQPDLLRLVSTQPYHTVQKLASSTFVPTTHNFFRVLHAMDSQMMLTHKFVQSFPHWHPFISQMYISFVIYIHIVRCMIEDNPFNRDLVEFYDTIHRHIGLESIVVPGPIVALLTALTNCSSSFDWIGNVCPTLPAFTGASAQNGYRLTNRLYMCLPSIPFICDQIHTMKALVNSTVADATAQVNYATFGHHVKTIFNEPVSATNSSRFNMISPNAMYYVHVPYSSARKFADLADNLYIPSFPISNATASAETMNYFQYLGFSRYQTGVAHNWLTTIGPIMSSYSQFFQGSVPLTSISPTGLGASIPIATFSASSTVVPDTLRFHTAVRPVAAGPGNVPPAVLAADAYIERQTPASNEATLKHAVSALSELAEQYSAIALVNCDFTTTAAASTDLSGPTNATIRSGEFWNLPVVRAAPAVNTAPGIAMNVAAHYHSSTPVKK